MARLPKFPKNSAAGALLLACSAAAFTLEVPAGTELQIRLKSKITTQYARAKDPVEAVVIAPVIAGGQFVIPSGAAVRGVVESVAQSAKAEERSTLLLSLTEIEIDGAKLKLAAQVSDIDNARETVDERGQINGILASDTITGQLDTGIGKVAERYAGFAGVLGAAKSAVLRPADTAVSFEAGTELTLKLTAPLTVAGPATSGPEFKLQALSSADEDALLELVASEPFRTMAQSPSKPSDITNLMLAGTEEQVQQAFAAAGWTAAAALNATAKFETFRALAENRGYDEAPVSILLLDGKPPDLVYQKMNNTFAKRHHLRIWARPVKFLDKPVWAVAATHDIGISFSETNRTFIHLIDSQIDRERAKVVSDLLFSGRVQSVALVDRPAAPTEDQNATGDKLQTDARIAVLVLK